MSYNIIQELFNCVHYEFCGFELFSNNSTKCHREGDVSSSGIVDFAADNLSHSILIVLRRSLVLSSGILL